MIENTSAKKKERFQIIASQHTANKGTKLLFQPEKKTQE